MDNNPTAPNPTPAAPSTEPTPAAPPAEPTKPIMGTTPGGHRNTPDAPPAPAPTTPEPTGEGTEGEPAPAATPQNNGQGNNQEPGQPGDGDIDYKTKFSESSREAQRLLQVIKEAGLDPETGKPIAAPGDGEPAPTRTAPPVVEGEPDPQTPTNLTDEQLSQAIPGFHNLSEVEKNMLRDTKATVKSIAQMQNMVAEIYDERVYTQQFTDLIAKDEFKAIGEHADEFKKLAYQKENIQVPLETLAASFLYSKSLGAKPKAPEPPPPTGLEPGSGGGKDGLAKTDEGYTAEEAAHIRKTDPKRYAKLAREGKLIIKS